SGEDILLIFGVKTKSEDQERPRRTGRNQSMGGKSRSKAETQAGLEVPHARQPSEIEPHPSEQPPSRGVALAAAPVSVCSLGCGAMSPG
ncbi:hypothetical protein M8C13_03100, partial [Crossiella sp. SN42]|uniref:hypothetical protein n=1 Tax=Crossiella sp. SN42 TaxID=2944808 RepID=UPI00207CDC67